MPTTAAIETAEVIIRETAYAVGGEVRPLPLLGMFGAREPHGWGPVYQMELLEAGHKLFPWLSWPDDIDVEDAEALEDFDDYYQEYMEYCAELGLPLTFLAGTQWEAMLLGEAYETGDPETSSSTINPAGTVLAKLNPFGLLAHWDAPATEYFDRDSWRRLHSWYASPPMVQFLSNNEATKVRWVNLETESKYFVDTYGTEQTDAFKKALLATQWKERYQRMIATMRTTIETDSEDWADVSRFIGYNAFGPAYFGRQLDWEEYEIVTDDAITPEWEIWDGGTFSYYANQWETNLTDHSCYSTQTQACNFPFQETEAHEANADYLCELALWTGDGSDNATLWYPALGYAEAYEARSKTCQYYALGQDYDLDRYEGWAQFGLWLTRPFILREFRFREDKRVNWPGYTDRLADIIDRIHNNPTKADFYRNGTLVVNTDHDHPYQLAIPSQYADVDRSFLLTTSVDPDLPWSLTDTIPVFAIAYVMGESPNRSWLLYAHSPLEAIVNCTISIPGYRDVTLNVPRKGRIWTFNERSETPTPAPAGAGSSDMAEIENLRTTLSECAEFKTILGTSTDETTADRIFLHRLPEKSWEDKMPFAALRFDRYFREGQYIEGGEYTLLLFLAVTDAEWRNGAPEVDKINSVTDAAIDLCKDFMNRVSTHAEGVFAGSKASVEDVLWPTAAEAATHGKFIRVDITIQWSRGR